MRNNIYIVIFLISTLKGFSNESKNHKPDLDVYQRLLVLRIIEDQVDYENSNQDKKSEIELRCQKQLFTYWVYTRKFNEEINPVVEGRFLLLAKSLLKSPNFQKLLKSPEPYTDDKGNFVGFKFLKEIPDGEDLVYEIRSRELFLLEMDSFQRFLATPVKR